MPPTLSGVLRPTWQHSQGNLWTSRFKRSSRRFRAAVPLAADGSQYAVLHSFRTNGVGGQRPPAGLIQGTDGLLYGTTSLGGLHNAGTIFQLGKDGSDYKILWHFTGTGQDGGPPNGLCDGGDGALYGLFTGPLLHC